MRNPFDRTHSRPAARSGPSGFTLIELLVVIAIILILASITFGISRGVQNAQARAKAKAELAVIAQGLEQFKSRYGDYPWHPASVTDTNRYMFYALTGRLILERENTNDPNSPIKAKIVADNLDNNAVVRNPKFIDHTRFSTSGTAVSPTNLLDPWGNPYIYWYKWDDSPDAYVMYGYHLYSTGPGGTTANNQLKAKIDETTGEADNDLRQLANELGIIFAGE